MDIPVFDSEPKKLPPAPKRLRVSSYRCTLRSFCYGGHVRAGGAGSQGVTGLLGKPGLEMLPGQKHLYCLTLGNSLQRSELISFVPRF